MAPILRDSTVVVVRTRLRAIPLAMITMMRKWTRGFPFVFIYGYGAPFGGPSGRRSSANIQAARPQRGLPCCRLKYCKLLSNQSFKQWQLSNAFDRSLFRSLSNRNLTLTPVMKMKSFSKQNLDVLVPKYIGTINFAFHFLEQTERADWGALVFGSWVDVISSRRPRLSKTRSFYTSSATIHAN